jgi:hypothetical protein
MLTARTHLKRAQWALHMAAHPDSQFRDTLLSYIDHGAPIFYNGPEHFRICKNWNSTLTFKAHVESTICADVAKGRKSGPFRCPPFKNFVGSPMGAFKKKRSDKVRTIHDLSWPPGVSVNAFIHSSDASVDYIGVDVAVEEIKKRGVNTLLTKVDLKDAYKAVVVRPADWHYLGSSWVNKDGVEEYYVDHVLAFGLRSSAKIFNMFASGLEFCMKNRGVTNACHYLDDFMSCGAPGTDECQKRLL